MIVEGLLTTVSPDGEPNLAPMGPVTDRSIQAMTLRPFPGSTTYENLRRHRRGVFHVTDDACLIAKAAIDAAQPLPPLKRLDSFDGYVLPSACRWYAVQVEAIDDSQTRCHMRCGVVAQGTLRDFIGFHRARHALIEIAILATRVHLLPPGDLRQQIEWLRPWVDKTGDAPEQEAFALVERYIRQRIQAS